MGDWIERQCAKSGAFWLYTALFAVGIAVTVDLTNIAISYFTCALLLLTVGGARRSDKAMHAKLDDLLCSVREAHSEMSRLEEKAEDEIEAQRR